MSSFLHSIIICLAILAIFAGAALLWFESKKNKQDNASKRAPQEKKNGLPVLPRSDRENKETLSSLDLTLEDDFIDTPKNTTKDATDALSDLAHATQSLSAMQPPQEMEATKEASEQPKTQAQPKSKITVGIQQPMRSPSLKTQVHVKPVFQTTSNNDLNKASGSANDAASSNNTTILDKEFKKDPFQYAREDIHLTIVPHNAAEMITGKAIIRLMQQYGLKYGAMNMFHRHANTDGTGDLWFSVAGLRDEKIVPFDLNTIIDETFGGLLLLLPLPHPSPELGFDGMISTAGMIAREINGVIYDEANGKVLERDIIQEWRQKTIDFK